ncbi:MAG: L-lysine 6-transaminase [bacterium]
MTLNNKYFVKDVEVLKVLAKYILADGFDLVVDMQKSGGATVFDKRNGRKFIDFFTAFASMPLGWNHKKINTEEFRNHIGTTAINKPSNADMYTEEMATFVNTFFNVAVPDYFKYSFFVQGGALAVENSLKAAFDWKVRQNFRKGCTSEKGHKIIHFKEAFHGRSGYTLSLTNTDPVKTDFFPKFDWPRITNPKVTFPLKEKNLENVILLENLAIEEMKTAFQKNKDDIAAIIIEPIQGEGGDNHFRNEFHQSLRELATENEALFIYDEVQTGIGLTGKMWAHEHFDVIPDIICFGKKMQTCGILATNKIDIEPENVFKVSSRINSTWGGNLVDMVRATRYLEIIEEDNLLENVQRQGKKIMDKLNQLTEIYPEILSNPRGLGMFCAFDFINADLRNQFRSICWENGLIILACGDKSIRFRPPLCLNDQEFEEGFEIIEKVMIELVN